MTTRREIEKRIARKEQEIADLRALVREAEVYVGALQDVLRILPKEDSGDEPQTVLRPGSSPAKARDALSKAGRPLHVVDLLKAMGLPADRKNRSGLSGTLAPYVRKKQVFTRIAPNTFGLAGMVISTPPHAATPVPEPPDDFGFDGSFEDEPDEQEQEPVVVRRPSRPPDDDIPF